MSVRTLFCEFCCRQADFREFHMCPGCRRTICKRCAVEAPFPPGSCIKRRDPCAGYLWARTDAPAPVVAGAGRRLAWPLRLLRRLFRDGG
ncbi:MAG: hypothetical protein SF028_10150 [Candidatus Sumerlaeia bacterium]|nr:hypothetical protein [Candidatus Sumerlaeia bacterium]